MPDGQLCERCRRPTRRRTNWLELQKGSDADLRAGRFHHRCTTCYVKGVLGRPETLVRETRANGRWDWVCDGCEARIPRGRPVLVVEYQPRYRVSRELVRRARRLCSVKREWDLCQSCANRCGLSSAAAEVGRANGVGVRHT